MVGIMLLYVGDFSVILLFKSQASKLGFYFGRGEGTAWPGRAAPSCLRSTAGSARARPTQATQKHPASCYLLPKIFPSWSPFLQFHCVLCILWFQWGLYAGGGLPAFQLRSERHSQTALDGPPTLRLCIGEEQQANLPYLAVRTEGEKEAKLFLTLT